MTTAPRSIDILKTDVYCAAQACDNASNSGNPHPSASGFFTPIGFSMGEWERKYNTRKGNTVHRLLPVITRSPARAHGQRPVIRSNTMSQPKDDATKAIISHVTKAVDTTSLSKSIFYDIGELFVAIEQLSEEYSVVRGLAKIGHYLTDDWGNINDCAREEAEAALSELRKLQGA